MRRLFVILLLGARLGMADGVEDMILGVAVGDAFGGGFEAMGREWIERNIDFTRYVQEKHGKWAQGYRLGDYTDDTSDTLAVMDALHDPRGFSTDMLIEHIQREYEGSRAARGGFPRAGFGAVADYFEGRKTLEEVRDYQRAKPYPGNAPPMRALPIGLIDDEGNVDNFAIINADVTHPHPKARAASVAIARAARYFIVAKKDPAGLIEYVRQHVKAVDAETYDYLGAVDRLGAELSEADYSILLGPQPIKSYMDGSDILGLRSDAMRTAGAALYIAKYAATTFEAIRRSILMGGDVDSLASITGGLLAGRNGLGHDLPAFLLEQLELRDRIAERGRAFAARGCAQAFGSL